MEYIVSLNNVKIIDSYKISKKDFNNRLKEIDENDGEKTIVFKKRSYKSLRKEWALHNLLYILYICRSRTKDVDLNYPQKWYVLMLYNFFGSVAILLIP